jgi:signal transduction histidine kinase
MKSFRWRMAVWFALSLLLVLGVSTGVTYLHLQHELRLEKWEREQPGHADWVLHGSYSKSEVDDIAGELWRLSLFYALPVAGVALGLGYFLATRSLGPLADLNRQLQSIGAGSLGQRVQLRRADREFQGIESNINALLARLEGAFRQLTEYSAQVAHELRAPLTLLRLQVEDAAGRIEPALAESLQEELSRLSDYVDQCLLLATAEQGRLALKLERVPLRAHLRDLMETYELWARSLHRDAILIDGEEILVTADTRYMKQMLHVLLSNAIRHGSGAVRVIVRRESDQALCRVENDVPPGTEAEGDANAKAIAGGRAAGVAGTRAGTGMGLRLARAIASSLGCLLTVSRSGSLHVAEVRWTSP